MNAKQNEAALTEAYHAIFDAKDKLPADCVGAYAAYEALQKLTTLMESLGFDAPKRFDGQGR